MAKGYAASPESGLPSGMLIALLGAFIGMGILSTLEVFVLAISKFRQRSGLYFWSVVLAAVGAFLFNLATAFLYLIFGYSDLPWLTDLTFFIGYALYVPAEYAVMYSRLHLLSPNRRLSRFVLAFMIGEFLIITLPNDILATGAFVDSKHFLAAYSIAQRVEVAAYTATEITLSGIYMFQVRKIWNSKEKTQAKKVLQHLLYINGILILLHATNVTLSFTGQFAVQNCWLAFVYGFQLKLEFWVLNKLTEMSKTSLEESHRQFGNPGVVMSDSVASERTQSTREK